MLIERTAGTLSSNTVTNQKEHAKAISLRSGRTYKEPKVKEAELEMKEVEQAEKTKENERASKSKRSRVVTVETYSPSIYDPPIPFPQRLKKNNVDDQFSKRYLEATPPFPPSMEPKVEDLKSCQPTSQPPKLELKLLPSNLGYAFLGQDSTFPVIINRSLSDVEESC